MDIPDGITNGKVAEWLKALLSKSSEGQLSESSNLSPSAMDTVSEVTNAGSIWALLGDMLP